MISARVESLPADEDDGPGVRGRRLHEPPDPAPEPPAGADAQDLPIAGDVDGDGRGWEEEDAMWTTPERGLNSRGQAMRRAGQPLQCGAAAGVGSL